MQSLTGVNYRKQHSKETTIARQERDYEDLKIVLGYLSSRNAFDTDPT